MVKAVTTTSIEALASLGLPPEIERGLIQTAKAGRKKGSASLYGVYVASWDLKTQDKKLHKPGAVDTANAVRMMVWQNLKFVLAAKQHHESFWILPSSVDKHHEQRLLRSYLRIWPSDHPEKPEHVPHNREGDPKTSTTGLIPDWVINLFRAANAILSMEGLTGTKFSVFPLITAAGMEREVADTFRQGLVDDVSRLEHSFDELHREYNEVIEIEDAAKKEEKLVPITRAAKRLQSKLVAYLQGISQNKSAFAAMKPAEKEDIQKQLDTLRRELPILSGEGIT